MGDVNAAVSRIQNNNKQSWNDWDVTTDELRDNTKTIKELKPNERNQAIEKLSDDELKHWAEETTGINGPLPADERRDLLNTLATSLDGKQAARVADAFGAQDMAEAVATHGTAEQKRDFIAAMQDKADGKERPVPALGASRTEHGNDEARAVAQVLGSLRDQPAELSQAIQGLEKAGKLDDVFSAASGQQSMTPINPHSVSPPPTVTTYDEKSLTDILAGVSQLPQNDPAREQAFKTAMGTLQTMQTGAGVGRPSASEDQSLQNVADAMGKIFSREEAIEQGLWTQPNNPDPEGISIDQNIEAAHANSGNIVWFYDQVKSGGPMDYKAGNDDKTKAEDWENFGNFNFGVVAAAHGFPEEIAKLGAGLYQVKSGTSDPDWIKSYFDDPRDTAQIAAGYDYYHSGMWRVWSGD